MQPKEKKKEKKKHKIKNKKTLFNCTRIQSEKVSFNDNSDKSLIG